MATGAHSGDGEELLRRALIDADAAVSVALRVPNLPVSDVVTVIFHGRQDLGTVQTYIVPGKFGAGQSIAPDALMRVPCDLDLAAATDRDQAEELYGEQAAALRDALVGADTVLDIWREPLAQLAGSEVSVRRDVTLAAPLPAPRVLPVALEVAERDILVAPVCGARTLAAGKPPLGIACVQHEVVRVYPLPDDPEHCLDDFFTKATSHARGLAVEMERQETSVQRFFELSSSDDSQGFDQAA